MRHVTYVIFALVLCVSGPLRAEAQNGPLTPQQIDQTVEDAVRAYNLPGASIAVVQTGQPTYVKGYGVAALETRVPVDQNTLFGIGSVSKAFTTTVLAMLVEEGRIKWDDPVINYLPAFRLSDAWVTREFTIRDLLTHRAGLAPYAGDLILLVDGKSTKPNVYRALANLPITSSFRSKFSYDNLLYVVAGDIIEKVTGETWEDAVTKRIFQPLGMTGCVASQDRVTPAMPAAVTHDYANGKLVPINFPIPRLVNSAGGIRCDAKGMAQWISFNLRPDGRLKLSSATLAELYKPVTLVPVRASDTRDMGTTYTAYGLGWFIQDSFGQRLINHGGGIPGATSYLSFYPERGLAIMVMVNRSSDAAKAITVQLASQAFGAAKPDYIAKSGAEELKIVTAVPETATPRVTGASPKASARARPPLALARYAGRYRDAWFGDVDLRVEGNALIMDMGSQKFTGKLVHVDADMFKAQWADRSMNADAYVLFRVGSNGEILDASMEPVSPETNGSYDFRDLKLVKVSSGA